MSRRPDDRVREALRDAAAPGESQAEARSWAVVREAFVERERQAPPMRLRARAAIALAVGAVAAIVALTPAGADVREWIADAIEGEEDARPALGSLPAPGSVLTESRDGVWIVRDDGSRRRLGDYRHATWSPNGLFVAAAEGRELLALTTQGEQRWAITAPAGIESLDWSSDDGFRVAYVAGRELRVVAGDGTSDVGVRNRVGSEAIAWQPESDPSRAIHRLAFVDGVDRVTLTDTDSGDVLWRSAPIGAPVRSLQWTTDGKRLLVTGDGFGHLLAADGRPALKAVAPGATAATLSPAGEALAVVRPRARGGSELSLVPTAPAARPKVLYPPRAAATGTFGAPTFSPDGSWVLLPWPDADQWLFIRVADGRVVPVGDVSRQLDADRRGADAFPVVAGWCC
jgi:hypothetical protein